MLTARAVAVLIVMSAALPALAAPKPEQSKVVVAVGGRSLVLHCRHHQPVIEAAQLNQRIVDDGRHRRGRHLKRDDLAADKHLARLAEQAIEGRAVRGDVAAGIGPLRFGGGIDRQIAPVELDQVGA